MVNKVIPVLLHIGLENTGSTSLQKYFSLNLDKLSEQGIYTFRTLGNTNNFELAMTSYDKFRNDDLEASKRITSMLEKAEYKERLWSSLKREVESQMPTVRKIVVSSEHFSSRLENTDEIWTLKSDLESLGLYIETVLIYIRNPFSMINSRVSTAVKHGAVLTEIGAHGFQSVLDYVTITNRWFNVFGADTVKIHYLRTDDSSVKPFSIMGEALSISTEGFELPGRENSSLSGVATSIVSKVNQLLNTTSSSAEASAAKLYFLNNMSLLNPLVGAPIAIPSELRRDICEKYSESLVWFKNNFEPDLDIEGYLRQDNVSEDFNYKLEIEAMANLIAKMALDNAASRKTE